MSELAQIMAMLHELSTKQDELAEKVEALQIAQSQSQFRSQPPSPHSNSNPNVPQFASPPFGGIDTIPCGPAPSPPLAPLSSSPNFSMSTSPRGTSFLGGGIEALRASFSSRAGGGLANALSSPQTGPARSGSISISQSTINGSGLGARGESETSGTATPFGNLSLAAATHGAGAPGRLTPPGNSNSNAGTGTGTGGGLAAAAEVGDKEKEKKKGLYPSRVVLTTYPGQAGIHPIPLSWGGGPDPRGRGPVVCSRIKSNLLIRNSIGAHAGSYSIYRALSIAMGQLSPDWRPDLTNTHPPFLLPPQPGWFGDGTGRGEEGNLKDWKIVSIDPWGAMSQEIWAKEYAEGLDVRPTISQTKAHIKIEELDVLARKGEFPIDGEIVIKSPELAAFPSVDQGVEINTYKAAIDPVWYLPGVAARLGIEESTLRRALFEDTGGMYPELLTRPDIKIFLPPIGGITVYIVGDPAKLSDPNTEVTCRPHDSCSGSDVFGSDICTCRPYLIFGISEAIKTAQRGGVGVIAYFVKEGRALGEVVKYMVYNRRKRGGDSAAEYFNNTSTVAGVKDARHQALMPDVLHFLGIKKITNLISMSNLKYDAIVRSGIEVVNRYEIPDELIPADSRVEIDAKIQSGYFSKKMMNDEIVKQTKGRGWEDIVH